MQQRPEIEKWFLSKPVRAGLIVFLVLCLPGIYLTRLRYQIVQNDQQEIAKNIAETAKSRLQESLQYSLYATQALAFAINKDGEFPENLDSIAASILSGNKYINALELVPDGVIRFVYPLEGNEEALNYNILTDPARNKEAFKTAREKKFYFAGPLELKQGGIAVVGRLPVYIGNKFWGFSAVIIHMDRLLAAANIDTSGQSGYFFQLSKVNPDTGQEEFFLPVKKSSGRKNEVAVQVPDGEWKLWVIPSEKKSLIGDILPVTLLSFAFALLGGFFTTYAIRKPLQLQKLVLERTVELDESEKRNRSIVNALPDMFFIIDGENRVTDFHNPVPGNRYFKPEKLSGEKIDKIFPEALAAEIKENLSKALHSEEVLTHSFNLDTGLELLDFEARYVRHTKDNVLVLVSDISERKVAQRELIRSREELRLLSNHLENIREDERLRIAHEIHDEMGQQLTVLKMDMAGMGSELEVDERFKKQKEKALDILNKIVDTVRRISFELRPSILDDLGLVSALKWYSKDFEKRIGIPINFESAVKELRLPEKTGIGLFRIYQESLTNAARHANASVITAKLEVAADFVLLSIRDNGRGFDKTDAFEKMTLGLLGMKERALMMNGHFDINSKPGEGTEISVKVPVTDIVEISTF